MELEAVQTTVRRIYPDGNCVVSRQDFKQLLSQLTDLSNTEVDVLMSEACKDGDDMVRLTSFIDWIFGDNLLNPPPPPDPVPVVFKTEIDALWSASRNLLKSRITDKDYLQDPNDEKMAQSFVSFVDAGLSAARWEPMDSERVRDIATKEDYSQVYTAKLGHRTDVKVDNLWDVKTRAEAAIAEAVCSAADNPPLQALLKELYAHKDALKWSQGSFGPKVYTADFLGTYANTMLSESLFRQPEKQHGLSYAAGRRPLECGIFYLDPGVEYPLHYHRELEAYLVLAGTTRFVWLVVDDDGETDRLVTMDRSQGEWHFNPPNVPHCITTPLGTPHLALWFREGGPGQVANNKFGPKWVGCVDGLDMIDEFDDDNIPDATAKDCPEKPGSIGAKMGEVFLKDTEKFIRSLTPAQFEYLESDPLSFHEIDSLLTPERLHELHQRMSAHCELCDMSS